MQTGSELDAEVARLLADRAGAPDRARGAVEARQEPVAGVQA